MTNSYPPTAEQQAAIEAFATGDAYRSQLPIPAPQAAVERPAVPSATPAPPNASSIPQRPAPAIPAAAILCGPRGRIAPQDLEPGDKAQVERFARYLRERKELTEHYGQLLTATPPGTAEYSRIADERATKLRQLNDRFERDTDATTRSNA